ncbi:hypothetical protein QUB56_08465 [Microcoleus sp. AR_TQ3_B6]|uniref:hypothetical protein n=1 Tax=Microcoleus sp. AR_TQ3_B6 TaxID=3055284 RepID=UPI002FD02254
MELAAIRDILPDRILENYRALATTHLGMMIFLCSGMSKLWARVDRPAAGRAEPDG